MKNMKNMKKNALSYILCMVLVVAMALCMTACNNANDTQDNDQQQEQQVEKSFTFVSVDADGKETKTEVSTDKKTVGEALVEEGLVSGEVGQYGLLVDTVNGVTVDYEKDGAYWAFYIDGEYAQTGVDSTDVVDGSTYTFKVEKG